MNTLVLHQKALAGWWRNPGAYATTLLALLMDRYGTEVFDWDPRTIDQQIYDDSGVKIPPRNFDKVMALITALTTDLFYTSIETFTSVANALVGEGSDFEVWDPITAEDAAWAITEVSISDSPPIRGLFSDDVRSYLGVLLSMEGIVTPPDVLSVAVLPPMPKDTYADDPEIYSGFYKLSQVKAEAIKTGTDIRLQELIDQLEVLPLVSRDHDRWNAFMARAKHKLDKAPVTTVAE